MATANDISGMQSSQSYTRVFTQETANLLHAHIASMSRETVNAAISWRENSDVATVAFQIKDRNGKPQMIRIHGEYFKLRDRISHHLGGRHA